MNKHICVREVIQELYVCEWGGGGDEYNTAGNFLPAKDTYLVAAPTTLIGARDQTSHVFQHDWD